MSHKIPGRRDVWLDQRWVSSVVATAFGIDETRAIGARVPARHLEK